MCTRREKAELIIAGVPVAILPSYYITISLYPDWVLASVICAVLGGVVGHVLSRTHVARLRQMGRMPPKVNLREMRREHEAKMAELYAKIASFQQ